jgi:ASC-1-like (ASCH) protein
LERLLIHINDVPIEAYNAGMYQIAPYVTFTDQVKVGSPFLVMRYRLLDLWVLTCMKDINIYVKEKGKEYVQYILKDYLDIYKVYEKLMADGRFEVIFPVTYAGTYEDILLNFRRLHPYIQPPPYIPFSKREPLIQAVMNKEVIKRITCKDPWLSHIISGVKDVEGRCYKGIFQQLRVGDVVEWYNTDHSFMSVINDIRRYKTFEEYLLTEGLARTLPGIQSIAEGVAVYRQWFSVDQEKEYGVCAIELVPY